MDYKYPINKKPYKVLSIENSSPPTGADGADWYHYVIEQNQNTIHGYQQGTLESVEHAVNEIVDMLNERRRGKYGRTSTHKPKTTTLNH